MSRGATVNQARAMRRNASATERALWKLLRDRRLEGVKLQRQVPMGTCVLDFVCLRHPLIVEADGPFHVTRILAEMGTPPPHGGEF